MTMWVSHFATFIQFIFNISSTSLYKYHQCFFFSPNIFGDLPVHIGDPKYWSGPTSPPIGIHRLSGMHRTKIYLPRNRLNFSLVCNCYVYQNLVEFDGIVSCKVVVECSVFQGSILNTISPSTGTYMVPYLYYMS